MRPRVRSGSRARPGRGARVEPERGTGGDASIVTVQILSPGPHRVNDSGAADRVGSTPMDAIRFDHIAIGARRMSDAPAVLAGILGGTPAFGETADVFRWGLWTFEGGGGIEVIEPVGADGFLHRFLAQRGPGVHHVTFKVPSLAAVCDRAAA